jgi:pimeloyl-ACP methyl ester carboxylesterase
MANEARYREAEQRLWSSLGATPEEHWITLSSGERVRVLEIGDGPPALFIHGGSAGASSWAPLAARLANSRCLLIDRPGCGLSDPALGGKRFDDINEVHHYADELIARVLDASDIDVANVVSTSLGGYYAFRGAAAHPDRVRRIAEFSWTIGATMVKVPAVMRFAAIPGVANLTSLISPNKPVVRMMLKQIGLGGALESGAFDDHMLNWFLSLLRDTNSVRNEVRATPKVITPRGLNEGVLLKPDLLAKVTMPVLLLWGADDPNGGEAIAREFTAMLPQPTLEMIPNAGHAPWIDEPELAVTRTEEFLAG